MYALDRVIRTTSSTLAPVLGVREQSLIDIRANTNSKIIADLALPCFAYAKELRRNPNDIAVEAAALAKEKLSELFEDVTATGGFVNFRLNPTYFATELLADFAKDRPYGTDEIGHGQTVVTDFSSPNIAKPFSVGHLRSTVIGDAINNLHRARGYAVIGDNHLGDWGTQFGKLIVAYKHWGDKAKVEADPIPELKDLYVRFTEETTGQANLAESQIDEEEDDALPKSDHPLVTEARDWFRKLEAGDKEARELWQWFVDLSMKDFERIYRTLGVDFQEMLGESFYEDKMAKVVTELERQGKLVQDAGGAKLVPTEVLGLDSNKNSFQTPLMVVKSDGASVYATRDLATAVYRHERWQPAKILYVVGQEQIFYFEQLFPTMRLLGVTAELKHIYFGLVLMKGEDGKAEKMSTRRGKVILLEKLIDEAVKRARAVIGERSDQSLTEVQKDEIARMVGVGAIKYFDLSRDRKSNIVFDWDAMLSLEGNSGPYLQYMVARINSLLEKAGQYGSVDPAAYGGPERPLLLQLANYPAAIADATKEYEPHRLAKYLYDLSSVFSTYYNDVRINDPAQAEAKRAARLELAKMVGTVLKSGLKILGIDCPEKM